MRGWQAWLIGAFLFLGGGAYLAYALSGADKTLYLPGKTSDGHYLIENRCEACHGNAFGGDSALEASCRKCHQDELREAEDSHGDKVFRDPRTNDQLAIVDARRCLTCHREHKPEITRPMGVTLPEDFCFPCHQNIAEERPSHRTFDRNGCASAGCHRYHDNRALYEEFLLKHANETINNPSQKQIKPVVAKSIPKVDAPSSLVFDSALLEAWQNGDHARNQVNCRGCHGEENDKSKWVDRPDHTTCKRCHVSAVDGFLAGKHGMRTAQGLSPLSPAMARLPMKSNARNKVHGCNSCHSPHKRDRAWEAVESCLGCHNDQHSLAYKNSPHYKQWQKELAGNSTNQSGVSCATCHLPKELTHVDGNEALRVQHNQNLNLRPNEKMVRSVCLDCHALGFSLDALADRDLIKNNFASKPMHHIASIEMAQQRVLERKKEKINK